MSFTKIMASDTVQGRFTEDPDTYPLSPTIFSPSSEGGHTSESSWRSLSLPADGGPRHRNLVVCIDGTGNSFGKQTTNVLELHGKMYKDKQQLTFYRNGIGTYVNGSHFPLHSLYLVIQSYLEMAFAWNVDRTIKDAYHWLSQNYEEGDRIYLFGFSRGAYQVRALSAMIGRVGLVTKGHDEANIVQAYKLYMHQPIESKPTFTLNHLALVIFPLLAFAVDASLSNGRSMTEWFTTWSAMISMVILCVFVVALRASLDQQNTLYDLEGRLEAEIAKFKASVSNPHVGVHFIGCWDTVTSIGSPWATQSALAYESFDHVKTFRHALALDECRAAFSADFVSREAYNSKKTGAEGDKISGVDPSQEPDIKEVWFPGAHSDVGGSHVYAGRESQDNKPEDQKLINPALEWMTSQAEVAGLAIKNRTRHNPNIKVSVVKVNDSMSFGWSILELLPSRARTNDPGIPEIQWRGNRGAGRFVRDDQYLHISARAKDYIPKATYPTKWNVKSDETSEEEEVDEGAGSPPIIKDHVVHNYQIDTGETRRAMAFGDGFLGLCRKELTRLILLSWIPVVLHAAHATNQFCHDSYSVSFFDHFYNVLRLAIHAVLARLLCKATKLDDFLGLSYGWMYKVNPSALSLAGSLIIWALLRLIDFALIIGRYLGPPVEYIRVRVQPPLVMALSHVAHVFCQISAQLSRIYDCFILRPWLILIDIINGWISFFNYVRSYPGPTHMNIKPDTLL